MEEEESFLFDYAQAFSRNVGWITESEQQELRQKRVALAGLGGAGGLHLLTLARLGVGKFTLAEYDRFELANFNRQVGATTRTLGRPKLDVLISMAREINPEIEFRSFPEGITSTNVDDFLNEAHVYVDGLDFFSFRARRDVYAACARRRIPTTLAVPLGMGVSVVTFSHHAGGMTFEDYFCLDGVSETNITELAIRFLVGVSPAMLQAKYLVDETSVDLARRKGPSTPMACQLCAGAVATEALKLLLKRGKVLAVPWGFHFDAYRNRYVRTWRPGGNRNPLQQVMIWAIRRRLAKAARPGQG